MGLIDTRALRSWLAKRRQTLRLSGVLLGILVFLTALIAIGVAVGGVTKDLSLNIATELFGAVVTVLLLDSFLRRSAVAVSAELRSIREEQERLRAELQQKARSERQYLELMVEQFRGVAREFVPVPLVRSAHSVESRLRPRQYSDITRAAADLDQFAIVGPPASGKSTNARFLAYQSAIARLERLDSEASQRPPLPFWIPLAEAEVGLDRLLQEHWSRSGVVGDLLAALADGSLWLFFDGLDEISSSAYRGVIEELRHLLFRYPRTKVLVTSRITDYDPNLGIPVVVTGPLDRRHAREYIQKKARTWGLTSTDEMIAIVDALPPLTPFVIGFLASHIAHVGATSVDLAAMFWRSRLADVLAGSATQVDDLLRRLSLLASSISTAGIGISVDETEATRILGVEGLATARKAGLVEVEHERVRFFHIRAYEYFLSRGGS